VLGEAGDFLIPMKSGLIKEDHLKGELADIILGKVKGRQNSTDITIFKSLGIGMEDLASAYLLYNKAKSQNLGDWVDFTGSNH